MIVVECLMAAAGSYLVGAAARKILESGIFFST